MSAYYAAWDASRLPPSAIDYSAVTHIIHFVLQPNADGTLSDPYSLDPALVTAAHAAGVKVLVSIGTDFSQAQNSQPALINNIVNYMQSHNYDGVDVDWESDLTQWPTFVQALRSRLDQISPRPLLVAATGLGPKPLNDPDTSAQTYAKGAPYLDQMNLMTYDMSGNWGGWPVWHSSPLARGTDQFPCCSSSTNPYYLPAAEDYASRFVAAGIPASKVGIGVGFVGERWHGVTAPLQTPPTSAYVDFDVYYSDIMANDYSAANDHFDTDAQVPWLGNTSNNTFLSYENAQSIASKAAYVKSSGIGGVILWHLAAGHISTAPTGSQDPLLQAVKQNFRQ